MGDVKFPAELDGNRWRCALCVEPAVVANNVVGRRKWVA